MPGLLMNILYGIIFIYTAFSVVYLFVFSISGRLFYKKVHHQGADTPAQKKIAVLVPAYKEDGIILSTAKNLVSLNYPSQLYDVYIIADSFKKETIDQLKQVHPVQVMEVHFEKSTKSKSLNEAFARITKQYDVVLILDADNILPRDFLLQLNTAFVNGAVAVQGRRVAKNLDTSFAILDACSEGINNNIFRKGMNALGLSCSVIGSGMAFDYSIFRQLMSEIKAVGGFDKIVQLKIAEQGIHIHYLENALIFDEKVDSSQAFKQQRKRWVSSQFIYLKRFFNPAFRQLLKGNINYFNLAIAHNSILPRAYLFILLPVLVLAGWFLSQFWFIAATLLIVIYILALVLALPSELVNRDLVQAVSKLPKAIIVMIGTLFGIRKADKTFIHTLHTKTEVSNPLYKEHSK